MMRSAVTCLSWITIFLNVVNCEIFFHETFDKDSNWATRWVQTTENRGSSAELFQVGLGKWSPDIPNDQALKTTTDYRAYSISARLNAPLSLSQSAEGDFVLSFSMKNEQIIECGGGFIKLFGSSINQNTIDGNTPYILQFGPDVCGTSTREISFKVNDPTGQGNSFNLNKNSNQNSLSVLRFIDDHLTHHYTLRLKKDNTFEIYIDTQLAHFLDGNEARGKLDDLQLLQLPNVFFVGFELWQVKAGSVFDDVIISNNLDEVFQQIGRRIQQIKDKEFSLFQNAENERLQQEAYVRQQVDELREKQEQEYAAQLEELNKKPKKKVAVLDKEL